DRFVAARRQGLGLKPVQEADKPTLLRRVTFDLIGLPPTPAEIRAFLADRRPDAYERLVHRLLASPQYGERWGRHWIDVVHYASTRFPFAGSEEFASMKFPREHFVPLRPAAKAAPLVKAHREEVQRLRDSVALLTTFRLPATGFVNELRARLELIRRSNLPPE